MINDSDISESIFTPLFVYKKILLKNYNILQHQQMEFNLIF